MRVKCQENQLKQAPFGFFFISWSKEICHLEICKNSLSLSWSQKIYWKNFQWKIIKIGHKGCMSSQPTVRQRKTKRSGSARFCNAKGRPGSRSDLDCDLIAAHFAKIVIGLGSVLWQKIVIGSDLANEKKDRLILWIMVVQFIGAATRPPPKKNLLQIFATT